MHSQKAASRRSVGRLALVSMLMWGAACAPTAEDTPQVADATVFEGARLILGDQTPPIESGTFVVQGDRITSIGATGQVDVPDAAARVDLSGKTVIPALIDAHKHVAGTREELVDQLEQFAYFGVGGVLSLGLDDGDLAFQVRDAPMPAAARLFTAGRGITAPEPGRTEVPYWVTTEDEARSAVRELAARRVDWVKIWVDDRNGQYEKLPADLRVAVIDEAHSHNLRVAAHITYLDDAKQLLDADIDMFAHSVGDRDVDEAFIEKVAAHPNVFLVPNLTSRGVAVDMSWLRGSLSPDAVDRLQAAAVDRPAAQEAFGVRARNLKRLNDAGMRIALGTDGATPWAAHEEMEDMVAAGMTPAAVLVAATSTAAELVGAADTGSLAAGMIADFVVLDANPLDDIRNTRRISAVYLRGQAVNREAVRSRMLTPVPTN